MTKQEIRIITGKLAGITRILADADADAKSGIFRQLDLKLTYHPGKQVMEVSIEPAQLGPSGLSRVNRPGSLWLLASEFALDGGNAR